MARRPHVPEVTVLPLNIGKVTHISKVVRWDRGVLAVDADGQLYGQNTKPIVWNLQDGHLSLAAIEAVFQLGVIGKDQRTKQKQMSRNYMSKLHKLQLMVNILDKHEDIGLMLTDAQKEYLRDRITTP